MKRYVINRLKNIKSFLFLYDFINGISSSMFPASFRSSRLIIFPLLSIMALIPLLADLNINELCSIALKMAFAKCCWGPIESPNHPSSEILTIKFVLSSDF